LGKETRDPHKSREVKKKRTNPFQKGPDREAPERQELKPKKASEKASKRKKQPSEKSSRAATRTLAIKKNEGR